MKKVLLTLSLVALGAFAVSPAAAADDVTGLWKTADGDLAVRFAPCDDGLCGTLVWVSGGMELDVRNPDGSKRDRELAGLAILAGFEDKGDTWKGGEFYDPIAGTSFRNCKIELDDDGSLKLSGFKRGSRFRKSRMWVRATEEDLAR